jgi:hypothetical protein
LRNDLEDAILLKLAHLYETELGRGPVPLVETRKVGHGKDYAEFHGNLVLYLSNIAGIASHGKRLKKISAERKHEFQRLSALPFFARYPQFEYIEKRIQSSDVPDLKRLLDATEEARLLIVKALAEDPEQK